MRIQINRHVIADSKICGGTLTFKGTRIMVWQILELLAASITWEKITKDYFPALTKNHIKAALGYAANIAKGKNLVIVPLAG